MGRRHGLKTISKRRLEYWSKYRLHWQLVILEITVMVVY
jgi:hypothetical protein